MPTTAVSTSISGPPWQAKPIVSRAASARRPWDTGSRGSRGGRTRAPDARSRVEPVGELPRRGEEHLRLERVRVDLPGRHILLDAAAAFRRAAHAESSHEPLVVARIASHQDAPQADADVVDGVLELRDALLR